MTLENLIKTGKKLALGATLALLTIAPQFNQNKAYAQSNKYSINYDELFGKEIKTKKVSMRELLHDKDGMIGDIDVADDSTIVFEYITKENNNIYIIEEGADSATQLTFTGTNRDPFITPDGIKILYSGGEKKQKTDIYFVKHSKDSGKWTSINVSNDSESNDFQGTTDNEGEMIVWTKEKNKKSDNKKKSDIYLAFLEDSKVKKVVNFSKDPKSWNYQPHISGNKKKVAYVSENDWELRIDLKDTETNLVEIVEKNRSDWYGNPQPNFDGTKILYEKTVEEKRKKKSSDIYLKNMKADRTTILSNGKGYYEKSSFSQDGFYAFWTERKSETAYVFNTLEDQVKKLKGYSLKNKKVGHLSELSPNGLFIGSLTNNEQNPFKWERTPLMK